MRGRHSPPRFPDWTAGGRGRGEHRLVAERAGAAIDPGRDAATQKLCRITVPGLSVKRDFTAAREQLLAGFPDIDEVIATTAPGTLLVLSSGDEDVNAWLDVLLDLPTSRQGRPPARLPLWTSGRGGDSAA